MKTQTNLILWKHKAASLISLAWDQIRMGKSLENPHFSRCCGVFHVKTLAVIIAIFEIFYLIYEGLVAVSLFLSPSPEHALSALLCSLAVFLATLAVSLYLVGICRNTPILLVPHMVMQAMFIFSLSILSLYSMYALLVGTSVNVNLTVQSVPPSDPSIPRAVSLISIPKLHVKQISKLLIGILVLLAVGYFMLAMINIWCFHVVLDCYRWMLHQLAEKANALNSATSHPPSNFSQCTNGGPNGAHGHNGANGHNGHHVPNGTHGQHSGPHSPNGTLGLNSTSSTLPETVPAQA